MQKTNLFGAGLIFISITLNPFLVEEISTRYAGFEIFNQLFYIMLVLCEIGMFFLGLLFIKKPKKAKKILPSILLCCFSVIVSLILMEILLNVSHNVKFKNGINGVASSEFHHMYMPNSSGYRYPGLNNEFDKVFVTINELGMRGNSIPPVKNEKRILILGDSFIEAEELPLNLTVGQLLQSELGDKEYLVMQQGFSSWSPLLQLNFLIKNYDILQPDSVFIVLVINDFYDADIYAGSDSRYTKKTLFDNKGYPISFTNNNKGLQFQYSIFRLKVLGLFKKKDKCERLIPQDEIDYLMNMDRRYSKKAVIQRLDRLTILENIIRLGRPYNLSDDYSKNNIELSFKYILLMRDFLEDRNTSLTVLFTPLGWNLAKDETILGKSAAGYCLNGDVIIPDTGIRNKIADFCSENDIEYIELIDKMENYKNDNPSMKLFFRMDGHWNKNGHEFMKDVLHTNINDRSII